MFEFLENKRSAPIFASVQDRERSISMTLESAVSDSYGFRLKVFKIDGTPVLTVTDSDIWDEVFASEAYDAGDEVNFYLDVAALFAVLDSQYQELMINVFLYNESTSTEEEVLQAVELKIQPYLLPGQ